MNVHDAKTRLSQLISAAERGEEVIIARNGVPAVRLVALTTAALPEPGAWRAEPGWEAFEFDPAILAPLLTDEELAAEGWPV